MGQLVLKTISSCRERQAHSHTSYPTIERPGVKVRDDIAGPRKRVTAAGLFQIGAECAYLLRENYTEDNRNGLSNGAEPEQ